MTNALTKQFDRNVNKFFSLKTQSLPFGKMTGICEAISASGFYTSWKITKNAFSCLLLILTLWRLVLVARNKKQTSNTQTSIPERISSFLLDRQIQILLILTSAFSLGFLYSFDACGFEKIYSPLTLNLFSVIFTFHSSTALWLVLRLFALIVARFHKPTKKLVRFMDIYTVVMLVFGSCSLLVIGFGTPSAAQGVILAIDVLELIFLLVIIIGISVYAVKVLSSEFPTQFPPSSPERYDYQARQQRQLKTIIRVYQGLIVFILGSLVWQFVPTSFAIATAQSFFWLFSNFSTGGIILYLAGRVRKEEGEATGSKVPTSEVNSSKLFSPRHGSLPLKSTHPHSQKRTELLRPPTVVIEMESRPQIKVFVPGSPNGSTSSETLASPKQRISPPNPSSKTVSPASNSGKV